MNRLHAQRPDLPIRSVAPFRRRFVTSLAGGVLLLATFSSQAASAPAPATSGRGEKEAIRRAATPPAIRENAQEILEIERGERPVPVRTPVRPSAVPRVLSPMVTEMREVLDREKAMLRELQDRFEKAPHHEAALAVQREIEKVKRNTELSLLRLQGRHARREGRNELAERIEAAIDRITNPQRPTPRTRPLERRGEAPERPR